MAEGRGRLSSIDELPEEAQDDIVWTCAELNQRIRTQADILEELNNRLLIKGLGPISRSAFGRFSMKRAMAARRIAEARGLFAGLADQFTPDAVDEGNIVLGEFLKLVVFELAQRDAAEQSEDGAMKLARAYLASVQAQKISSERRAKVERDFVAKADAALDKLSRESGLPADRVAQIRRDVLGLRGAGKDAGDKAGGGAPAP
jgi:hypothetical protein